jgi:PKD repeat protein
MKIRTLIFLTFCILFLGCKKFIDAPKETCFIPYVDFVAYNVNPSTLEVSFSSISSFNGTITSHHWDFGDGTTFDGEIPPAHKYPAQNPNTTDNSYRVKYTVSNACGEAYWTDDIKISKCLADVKFSYKLLNDSTVQFTNSTTSSSPVTYVWDFGDSTKSTSGSSTVNKIYQFDGKYTVTLKATNACGINYFIANIPVCNKPVPSQKVTQSGCSTIEVDASATRNGAWYQWDFGNGTVLPESYSSTPHINYTYPKSGSFKLTLTVVNKNGCDTVRLSTQVKINAVSVVPNNEWSYTSDDLEFDFKREPVINATSYSWDFGDGTTSDQQNPGKKVYANPGVYTLTLGAKNSCGDYSFSTTLNVPNNKEINNAPNTGFSDVEVFSAQEIYFLGTNGKLYKTDTAGHWSNAISLPGSLAFNNETALFVDVNNDLWVYGKKEIAKLDRSGLTWNSFFNETKFDRNTTITSMAVDKAGNLWTIGDRELRKNNKVINQKNTHFSSLAYDPNTDRIWLIASNKDVLYYINTNGSDINTVDVNGMSNGSIDILVQPNGEIYFSTVSGIMRVNSSGTVLGNYNATNTGGLLAGPPKAFVLDGNGNIWAIHAGRLLKVPLNGGATFNYSTIPRLANPSSLDILKLSATDNDIILSKTTGDAAIQIK